MQSGIIASAAVALFVCGAATVSAQSLADVARKEEARRKTVKSSGKVYTNDSLRHEEPPAVPAAPPAAAQHAPAAQTTDAADQSTHVRPEDNPKAEPYWRKRMTAERQALARAESYAEALQSRINALTTDFVNRDDPAQQRVIGENRMKALAELDRAKQEIQQHTKTLAAIQEEARRAGVPAGWVR
jgi:hypothetical protein